MVTERALNSASQWLSTLSKIVLGKDKAKRRQRGLEAKVRTNDPIIYLTRGKLERVA